MGNKVLIGIDPSQSFRIYITDTTQVVEEARKIHKTTPLASAGLGRVLTATGLMGVMLKNEKDRVTTIFKGEGPAEQILVAGNGRGEVKGYISNPKVTLPLTKQGKLDVGGSLGIGELTVIKDMGLKEPYTGTIALVRGEIAEDLAAYYYISEQQNTTISLGVKVGKEEKILAAGGFFLQLLPGGEKVVEALEELSSNMKPITTLLEEERLKGGGKNQEGILEGVMQEIFKELPEEHRPEALEYKEISWNCDCSRERITKALMAIGKKELSDIIKEDGKAQLHCHFCETSYDFKKEELEEILKSID